MALQKLAAIAVRPRRTWRIAALSIAALMAAGCSHSRKSYRPVYATPRAGRRPLHQLRQLERDGHDRRTGQRHGQLGPVARRHADSPIAVTSPSTVPSGRATDRAASSTVEKPPKSRLGRRAGPSTRRCRRRPPRAGRRHDAPAAAQARQPELGSGPRSARAEPRRRHPSAWDTDSQDGVADQPRRPRSRVRRASLSERLRPFVDESSANELIYPNKADRPWRYIVLHHSASASGNYDQIDGEHRKILGIDGCGYHFVIGNGTGSGDGQIEVAQRWINQKQGVHCRNARTHDVDEYGIGICLVGDLDQQPPSPRQIAATQALDRLSQQALQHRPERRADPRPPGGDPDGLPRQVFPQRSDARGHQGRDDRAAGPRHLEGRPRHDARS